MQHVEKIGRIGSRKSLSTDASVNLSHPAFQSKRLFAWIFYGLLIGYVAYIVALPAFPSQDGPVHLYYTAVLNSLLHHQTTYSSAFRIKHLFPPYSLDSYILLAAMKVLSPLGAEKLLVCLCVIVFAIGFRCMAFTWGPSAWITSLLALPFCFHSYLFFGFYNFSLSLGIGFLAIAAWNAGENTRTFRQSARFLILITLLVFAHPVTLAIVLLLAGSDVCYRLLRSILADDGSPIARCRAALKQNRARLIVLSAAALSIVYIAFYVHLSSTSQPGQYDIQKFSANSEAYPTLWYWIVGKTISPIWTQSYRIVLFALWWIGLILVLPHSLRRFRQNTASFADVSLLIALALAVICPFLPFEINGSAYFSFRLTLFCPLLILGAASSVQPPRRASVIALAGALAAVFLLFRLNAIVRPISDRIAQIERLPVPHVASTLGLARPGYLPPANLSYDPYFWTSAQIARRSHSVLRNGPWLELPIIIIGRTENKSLAPTEYENPGMFWVLLNRSPQERSRFLDSPSLLVLLSCESGSQSPAEAWLHPGGNLSNAHSTVGCVTVLPHPAGSFFIETPYSAE